MGRLIACLGAVCSPWNGDAGLSTQQMQGPGCQRRAVLLGVQPERLGGSFQMLSCRLL